MGKMNGGSAMCLMRPPTPWARMPRTCTVVKVTSAIASVMLRSAFGGAEERHQHQVLLLGVAFLVDRRLLDDLVAFLGRGSGLRGRLRAVEADRAHAGEDAGVVGEGDEDEDGADQGEEAAAEALAAGAFDEIEDELGGDFEEGLPAAGDELGAAGDGRADEEDQPHDDEHRQHRVGDGNRTHREEDFRGD